MNQSSSKTIVQINVTCNGSTGRIMNMIQQTANRAGYRSISVFGRGKPPSQGEFIKIGNSMDIYSHVALTRIFDKHGLGSRKATKKFISELEKINPSLIHLHNIHGYYINYAVLFNYIKEKEVPVIWTLHDCWAFTGHCSYFDYVQCDKWKTGCNKCPQKRSYPSSLFLDNSLSSYRLKKEFFTGIKKLTIVTPSNWLANLVSQSFLKEYPIKVINNGIDLNIFRPLNRKRIREKLGISEDQFIILGVAASFTDKRKGYNYFLELSEKIDDKCTIILIGVSKKQKQNLPKNIIGFTRTENIEELVEFYSMADVFVNPTLEDNFPTVNIEALAAGTPVVAFDTGGVSEVINEQCGCVVDKGNTEALFNAILEVRCRNKKYYEENCLNTSLRYRAEDKYNEYIKLYEEMMVDS
ncbi:glycosyltransferase [Saccharococcus caldoxylosilyticus]|uniref:glycosyltransferase n=1 Tax=Saccharococcus caldoxylosilyticus TaxID=81408 RepID=UPI001FCA7F91|nr:glycosyltransferase [Parageobacillus caldoxylosilyticus]BDG37653.1 glycosyl transferase [Parageobacillus caldoxylosilyticus]BDG41445.1 glycosyl transferase [Parageobacillus caldoxylosilyticus]